MKVYLDMPIVFAMITAGILVGGASYDVKDPSGGWHLRLKQNRQHPTSFRSQVWATTLIEP